MEFQRDLLSISPLSTAELSLDGDLALCRELGVGRVGLSMEKLEREPTLTGALGRVKESGLRVDLVYPSQEVSLADPGSWERGRHHLLAAIEVAVTTGATGVLFAGGGGHGLAWEDAAVAFEKLVAPVVERGRDHGVRVLLEPLRTQFAQFGFVHSLRDGVILARRADVGLVVDVTHCWWEPKLNETLSQNLDLIGTVQLADLQLDRPVTTRVVPGDGELPLARIICGLLEAGYSGPFELELVGAALLEGGSAAALARSMANLERLIGERL